MREFADFFLIALIFTVNGCNFTMSSQECTPGKARLVNGTRVNEGVLEVCTNQSEWSTVCNRYFYCSNTEVACRQAGYDFAQTSYSNTTASRLNPPKLGFYSCSGTENALSECSKRAGYTISTYCRYYYGVVGLRCSSVNKENPETNCTENAIRLVGGRTETEGQLQICRNQNWHDVCDNNYYEALGYIACRQLGYTGNWVSTSYNRHFYNSSIYPTFYTTAYCYGRYYSNIAQCYIYDKCQYCYGSEVSISCKLEKANCKERDLRLVGGPNKLEGFVEVCVNGSWGRINNKVEGRAKDVICSSLGFNETGATIVSSWTARRTYKYKSTHSPVLVKSINCCDRDKSFSTCDVHPAKVTDSFNYYHLALRCIDGCTNGNVRLVGGDTEHEGTVEICVSGIWKAAGIDQWDDTDANVVCQHLYPEQKYAYAVATNSSEFEMGSDRQVYFDSLRCTGAEQSVSHCSRNYVSGNTYTGPTAAVRCHPTCDCAKN